MNWKQLRWFYLAAAVAAGLIASCYTAVSEPSRCPDSGRLLLIVLGMFIATTSIHAWVTFIQTDQLHAGRITAWCAKSRERRFFLLIGGALMTAATLFVDIVLWALLYRHVGAIHSLETSLYFSGITFTTVGYGDITLTKCWQLLSVGEAVNGVLMAGWSAAQLIFLVQRMMTMGLHAQGSTVD